MCCVTWHQHSTQPHMKPVALTGRLVWLHLDQMSVRLPRPPNISEGSCTFLFWLLLAAWGRVVSSLPSLVWCMSWSLYVTRQVEGASTMWLTSRSHVSWLAEGHIVQDTKAVHCICVTWLLRQPRPFRRLCGCPQSIPSYRRTECEIRTVSYDSAIEVNSGPVQVCGERLSSAEFISSLWKIMCSHWSNVDKH